MTRLAEIRPDWRGETAAIFASGPSMTAQLAESCRALRTIAINNQSFDLAPWADVIYGSDSKWWRHYFRRVKDLPGRKVSLQIGLPVDGVDLLRASKAIYDDRPDALSTGGNSGYAALCLAAKLGATRVLLFGYDMRAHGARVRRHNDYPAALNSAPRFRHWLAAFDLLAPELARRGVEVINCTPESAIKCFQFQARDKVA